MSIMGRPRKEIDFKEFEKLCALHATKIEVAAWFDMDEKTLEQRISEHYGETFYVVFNKKKSKGKISLRRSQWIMAEKSPAMAIFLGKNYLGQKDSHDVELNAKVQKVFDTSKMTKEEYMEFMRKHIQDQSDEHDQE